MKPPFNFLVALCLVALSFVSCSKEQIAQVIPTEDYELVFTFDADEPVDYFQGEVSVDGIHWKNIDALVWPIKGTDQYIIPVRVEQGAQYYFRVRGETMSSTIYYTSIVSVRA